jgi:hypothetical protein
MDAVSAAMGNPPPGGVPMPADRFWSHQIRMTAQEVASHQIWERCRVLCEIHPGLSAELRASDSDAFPPEVLRRLPYPNPMVFLAEPLDITLAAGEPGRLVGWYVNAHTPTRHACDTTDERARYLYFTVLSEVLTDGGADVDDWDLSRVTLPLYGGDTTINDLVETTLKGFAWEPAVGGQTPELQRSFMSTILHVVVPHMLYLCSQTLDTRPKPLKPGRPARRQRGRTRPAEPQVDRRLIGFRIGPELAAQDRWEATAEQGEPRGSHGRHRPPAPHIRRAHFHTYRVGPGRRERVVKWLAPIAVNADHGIDSTTIVKIH